MAYEELAENLGGFEGFELVRVVREPEATPPRLVPALRADGGSGALAGPVSAHDHATRR